MKTSILSLLIIASLFMVSCGPKQSNKKPQETHTKENGHTHSKKSNHNHSEHDGHNH